MLRRRPLVFGRMDATISDMCKLQAFFFPINLIFILRSLGQSGVWKGVPFSAPALGAPTAQSEAFATEGGRPATFNGVACGGDGWVCSAAYENEWALYMNAVVQWLQAHVPNYSTRPHGIWYTINGESIVGIVLDLLINLACSRVFF